MKWTPTVYRGHPPSEMSEWHPKLTCRCGARFTTRFAKAAHWQSKHVKRRHTKYGTYVTVVGLSFVMRQKHV